MSHSGSQMYGAQPPPPPQSYYPTGPPPSYPEWQQSKPAEHGQSWNASQVSSPPPTQVPTTSQPATSFYNPNMYGPMPGSTPSPALDHVSHSQPAPSNPSPNIDTSTWGVRYNQHYGHHHHQSSAAQGSQIPPPLPPRPTSSLDQPQTQAHLGPQPWNTAQNQHPYYPPNPPTHFPEQQQPPQHAPQFWQPHPYSDSNSGVSQTVPPKPPPIPPAYQAEVQQAQQAQQNWPNAPVYSSHPPTHNYEPPQQSQQPQHPPPPAPAPASQPQPQPPIPTITQMGPTGLNGSNTLNDTHALGDVPDRPPSLPLNEPSLPPPNQSIEDPSFTSSPAHVPPPTPAPVLPETTKPTNSTPGASALGSGGPSDWEHFSSTHEEVDDTEAYKFKTQNPPLATKTFELASDVPMSNRPETSESESQPPILSTPPEHDQIQQGRVSPVSSIDAGTQHSDRRQIQQADRMNSVDSFSSAVSAEDSTGQIDNVIQEWSRPVPIEDKPPVPSEKGVEPDLQTSATSEKGTSRAATPVSQLRPSVLQLSPKNSPPITSRVDQPIVQSITTIADPYADLDPWYKSSLTRYVTMLRKEMATESDEEKFKIFTAFMTKESKLREILYSVEIVPDAIKTKPTNDEVPKHADQLKAPTKPELKQLDTELPIPMEQEDDVITYSPGGRPVLASSLRRKQAELKNSTGLQRSASNPTPPAQIRNRAESLNATSYVFSTVTSRNPLGELPRATSVPPAGAATIIPQASTPYTPFRYQEGPQRGSEPLSFERPAYQAYSALRQASAESGRVMTQPNSQLRRDSDAPGMPRPLRAEHDETFLGLVREKSVAYRGRRPESSLAIRAPTADPFKKGIATAILDDIRTLVPATIPNPAADARIAAARDELEKFPDDFNFMEKSLEAWDRGASSRQGQLDGQRRARQEASEHHIDNLFNNKEIGYSDINVLETEFKQTEAQKQLNEERREYDKFVEIVFTRVDERLRAEIATLEGYYKEALDLLNSEADSGSTPKLEKFHLSCAMKNAVDIFQKIEMRHERLVEAALERERRRKKAERRFFVFLGDSSALKQMDKDFDVADKKILLEAAKARDDRANQLMDVFDEASMRGIGENQSLLDDIFTKIEKLDPSLVSDMNSLPQQAENILTLTSGFVRFLGGDSESILSSFGMADRLLNNADYELSVAEAKVANASPDIFRRLEEEKKKEDLKIEDDLNARMADVRSGHQEILKSIDDVLQHMQKGELSSSNSQGGNGPDGAPVTEAIPTAAIVSSSSPLVASAPTEEEQQQDRLRKALEDAKRRNAAKQAP
ncbi:hypothetical protein DIZ76_014938 [Coccidioides immitis]|nr:hypothetical protein DIZ76_014938 [Coccidioides immitis]